jgi:Holliday junction resolvase RusA-like endonuclease
MKLRIDNCIAQKRHRYARGFVYDPSSKDKKIAIQQIKEQFTGKPYTDALKIKFVFHIKRPKAHFRTGKYSDELKKTAPVYHTKRPDVDNFVKFYMDCMNKVVYLDDSQVIELRATKEYDDKESYTEIII